MAQLNVLVVGASIAGPSAAYWFSKIGAKVTVIERFPRPRTGGQNVDIRNVGVTVMRKVPGMVAAVRANLAPIDGISFVRADGRLYGVLKSTGDPDQQSLLSEYEIYRGELSRIIADYTKDDENVKHVFGEQVVSMEQQEDGPVTVEFANGHPKSQFDLVVACDGATSRTRAIGLGCGVRDHIKSSNCWVAYFLLQRDLVAGSKLGLAYSAPGGRFIALGCHPSGGTRVSLMRIGTRGQTDVSKEYRDVSRQGDDALREYIAKLYRGAGWRCDEVMDGIRDAQDFYASEMVQVKVPRLTKGRFVLVGDAGYGGTAGMGTSLAMAGAYVLAGEVGRSRGDVGAGLRAYEEHMRPLIDEYQTATPVLGIMAPQTPWGIWWRNILFAVVCWTGVVGFAQRFSSKVFREGKHKLPGYEWVG